MYTTGCLRNEVEDRHGADEHKHTLNGVRPNDGDEATDGGVQHDYEQGNADCDLVGHAEKDLEQMSRAFEDGQR